MVSSRPDVLLVPGTFTRGYKRSSNRSAFFLPSPRAAVGRGRGWGVVQRVPQQRFLPIAPPPPPSRASFARLGPRHARGAWREGSQLASIFHFLIVPKSGRLFDASAVRTSTR